MSKYMASLLVNSGKDGRGISVEGMQGAFGEL
jgi:hypothetical protein